MFSVNSNKLRFTQCERPASPDPRTSFTLHGGFARGSEERFDSNGRQPSVRDSSVSPPVAKNARLIDRFAFASPPLRRPVSLLSWICQTHRMGGDRHALTFSFWLAVQFLVDAEKHLLGQRIGSGVEISHSFENNLLGFGQTLGLQ